MANSSLNRTNTSPSGSGYKYTFSAWIKRSKISERQMFWRVLNPSATTYYAYMEFQADDRLHINDGTSAGTLDIATTAKFRDTNAWYHIMGVVDTTQGTAADRVKLYVNGSQITDLAGTPTLTLGQNQATSGTASGKTTYVGGDPANNTRFFDGYMSHVAFVDGQALTPTSFGETDSTSGIWKFKSPSGITFGNNGFHLKMENSGAMGTDSSGESNTFTVNGNLKQAVDTPSNVFATWNPLVPTGGGFQSNSSTHRYGNNDFVTNNSSSNYGTTWSTLGMTTGKYYMEVHYESSSNQGIIGIIGHYPSSTANYIGGHANSYGIYTDGNKYNSGSSSSYGTSWTNGDYLGIFLDLDNNKLYFSKNGTVMNSGTGIDITAASLTEMGAYHFACMEYNSSGNGDFGANFGNGSFRTTQLTGTTYDDADGNGIFKYEPTGLTLDSSTKSFKSLSTKGLNT
jgi:hypothetical protein